MSSMGRLAIRAEGDFLVAYYARPDTMDGAVPLGSIHIAACIQSPQLKDEFHMLMAHVLNEFFQKQFGIEKGTVVWGKPVRAAELEKG